MVNNYAQYCSVVRTGIGKTKIVIGGEIDAGEFEVSISFNYAHTVLSVGL